MAKFRWEHGIQVHRLPLTDDLMRLIGITEHDENIQDLVTKQSTTLPFDVRAILHVGIEQTVEADSYVEHDLEIHIARGGELLGDFLARHFDHEGILVFSDRLDTMEIVCEACDEALHLNRASLVKLED